MSGNEPAPASGVIFARHLLGTAERRSVSFDARLAALAERPATSDRVDEARALRDDIRQMRASVAVVQRYLREQADLLRSSRRTERKLS